MKEKNKVPVSIHLLNTNLFEGTSFNDTIRELIERVNKEDEFLTEAKFSRDEFGNFSVRLFYSHLVYPPKWRGFFDPILNRNSALRKAENVSYSFVCFVGLDENIFAITGGFGAQKVSHMMIPDFGLEILVRLFDKNSKVVKNIQDRGLTGNILGQTKFYRGDQRFSDENQFGKIFKQVQAELNKELLKETFGFTEGQLKRSKSACMAKDSFQINKSVDFDTMLTLISKLAAIMNKKPKFSLNKVEHLSKRKMQNLQLIEKLDSWAINILYNDCVKGDDPDVDFCHFKFDTFLNADLIQILIEKGNPIEVPRHSTFGDIVRLLKKNGDYIDDDELLFKASVLDRIIVSYDNDGQKLTSDSIFEHVHGEFTYENKTYFLMDKEWYTIRPSFIKDLNEECSEVLKYAWDNSTLTELFNIKERESTYNQKYLNKANYYVFDTITPYNIEPCDIMKYDDTSIQLIHVKKGFDNSIRDLTSQIAISAKLIQQDLRSGFEYIERVQKLTQKSKRGELSKQKFPQHGLPFIFKGKPPQQITFCLAFVDKSTRNRNLKDHINLFNSNIAKFSLLELRNTLLLMGFSFKIIQIKKE
ncbi:MAG: TIGR04141 family sporadically distributed protein [Chitinophagaceae bacterium]|nr:TIGR04141 family sporadically distributed protein [Chitinophagaceae bacterium]